MSMLGTGYYTGNYGLSVDYEKAFELVKKSADQGNPIAQNNFAAFYFDGKAIPKNYIEAYKWLYIAFRYGNLTSAENAISKLNLNNLLSELINIINGVRPDIIVVSQTKCSVCVICRS